MQQARKAWKGNPVSPGIAIAKVFLYEPMILAVEPREIAPTAVTGEMDRFQGALAQAKEQLQELYDRLCIQHPQQAKIFAAHQEIMEDEELLEEVETAINQEHIGAENAVEQAFDQFAQMLAQVEDPLIAGRAADLIDVKKRLLRILMGKQEKRLDQFDEDVILVAHDLLPSDTATLDREHVKGMITEVGGSNSHCAILARSFLIPAILGVEGITGALQDGWKVILDAVEGNVICFYEADEEKAYEERRDRFRQQQQEEQTYLCRPGMTKDGTPIQIGMNIGSDHYEGEEQAYSFIGLFRSEFLYMEGEHLPTEEEQFAVYRNVLERDKGKTVTLRTLDIGGDKTLPYMELPKETNPFLGMRALRLCLLHPDIFKTQLRAALRASAYGKLQIMFPMVGSMEDIYRAKSMVRQVQEELTQEGYAYDKEIKLGIMIEIPSIALIADLAAKEVDFASIGSNDLTQYLCAADRMNAQTEAYYQSYSPAMLRILGFVFRSFASEGKPVSVCGEMAGNPKAAAILVGLGARKLSMNYASIPAVKAKLAGMTLEEMEGMANQCLTLRTEEEIRRHVDDRIF